MQPSNNELELTKLSEGCSLKSYQDTGGVWTIGYGHTNGVVPGQVITQQVAEDLLRLDIQNAVSCVNSHAIPCTQNQFDALVDFVFNVGPSQFLSSHLLAFHKAGQYDKAADEFPKWKFDNGKVIPGLVERRARERALYTRQEPEADHPHTDAPEHSVSSEPCPVPAELSVTSSQSSQVLPEPLSNTAPVSNNGQSEFVSQALALVRKLLGKG
jgi:lysozyme